MFITKTCLPRRTVLRGLGATLALPLLDGMVPPLTALRRTAATSVRRLGAVYVPNGMSLPYWTPATAGSDFALTPILAPLAPMREQLLVISGLNQQFGWAQPGEEGSGEHARAAATFLTGIHVKKTQGADLHAGVSMDQIAARAFGADTQLASLELGLDSSELVGSCDVGYSCAYANTIAWRTPTTPLPMENDPRAVFERLFGDSGTTDRSARLERMRQRRSVLDSVRERVAHLTSDLGPSDRAKLAEYLEAVRDVERRIQKAEEQNDVELPVVERPQGVPADFSEYATVMFDLQALAYQSDLTRVATFMIGHEVSARAYPEVGVPDAHHGVSHHQNAPEKLAKLAQINTLHMQLFARFVENLRSTPDGDGSLLDHTVLLYGAGLSDSNSHLHDNVPLILVGGGAMGIKGGRHLQYPKSQKLPVANLLATVLDRIGVQTDRFADSTGRLEQLSGV